MYQDAERFTGKARYLLEVGELDIFGAIKLLNTNLSTWWICSCWYYRKKFYCNMRSVSLFMSVDTCCFSPRLSSGEQAGSHLHSGEIYLGNNCLSSIMLMIYLREELVSWGLLARQMSQWRKTRNCLLSTTKVTTYQQQPQMTTNAKAFFTSERHM